MLKLCSLTVSILSLLLTAGLSSAKAGNDSIIIKAEKLRELYPKSISPSRDSEIYQQQFFNEFPNSFQELDEIYGWQGEDGPLSILYGEADSHILHLFNNLHTINDTLYYKKIISIAIGGRWDADAINYFQWGLRDRVEVKPALVVFLLKGMSNNKVKSFWRFYFDEPHPQDEAYQKLQVIKSMDSNIYNLMVQAHNEIIEKWK